MNSIESRRLAGYLFAVVVVLILATVPGCDAPRENPLDPLSGSYIPAPPVNQKTSFTEFIIKTHRDITGVSDIKYTIEAEVIVEDRDGVEDVQLDVAGALRYDMEHLGGGQYTFELPSAANIDTFLYSHFYVFVYDANGHVARSDREKITRILPDYARPESPTSHQVINELPVVIKWNSYDQIVNITYSILIQRDVDGDNDPDYDAYYKANIPRSSPEEGIVEEYEIPEPLEQGDYFWQVTVTDLLGNTTTSELIKFTVGSSSGNSSTGKVKEKK